MTVTLYQFPVSHYCEKVRWALDYKGIPFDTKNLLPGMHVKTIKKLAAKSSVPVIKHDGIFIQGSSQILDYLDEKFQQNSLCHDLREAEIMEWEKEADQIIGPEIRRFCYHHVLDDKNITVAALATGGPWYGKMLLKKIYPQLMQKMRQLMQINDGTAEQALETIHSYLDKLAKHMKNRTYIVGDKFSRVDLTVASLLGPLLRPVEFDQPKGVSYPLKLQTIRDEMTAKLPWVSDMYNKHRLQS